MAPLDTHSRPRSNTGPGEPQADCPFCPRLAAFREANRTKYPEWFNAPVPSFGPKDAPLLIVGLAPGLKGANRTGRPFTGDFAGVLLYETLLRFGLASGTYAERLDDGLVLTGCRITNAVRCVPPQNKPLPGEIAACRGFLGAVLAEMQSLRAILALGRIAFDTALRAAGLKPSQYKFAHGGAVDIGDGRKLFGSYHCSRYNTNTGRLTPAMFHRVFEEIVAHLGRTG
ncbi:MAG: uracil-DNA glycosylase [Rhodomicrobium sp.]